MYEFEKHPKLTEFIQEMANTGRVPQEWSTFLETLNQALRIHDVVGRSEQLKCHHQYMNAGTLQGDALLAKLKEMEVAAAEMEKAAWIAGAENTAMTSNGAKIAYRAVIGLLEKGII